MTLPVLAPPEPIFEDPPESGGGRGRSVVDRLGDGLEMCRQHPRKWVRLYEYSSPSSAYGAKKSLTKAGGTATLPGKWEFVARTLKSEGGTTVGRIYAKYHGTA